MTERFNAAWLARLDAAAAGASVPPDVALVIQQVVTNGDDDELAYTICLADGAVSVRAGRADHPDVTFRQDRATAAAIADGALSAQAAFMAGRLRVAGDLHAVLERLRGVLDLDGVFAAARAGRS